MTDAHAPLRTFGRIRGRTIKPRQAVLMETLLPKIALHPEAGPIDPALLAPDAVETWLEIGFGGGEHMAEQAARRPDVLVLGAEPFLNGVASALRHIDERGLSNVRLHAGDARAVLEGLPEASLARLYILFPDPWPKTRHRKRRLVSVEMAGEFARVLKVGARLRFATDVSDYADRALEDLMREPRLRWLAERADDWRIAPADHVATRYEAKRLGDIKPVFYDFERV